MKIQLRILSGLVLLFVVLSFSTEASAHVNGKSVFRIDDVYTKVETNTNSNADEIEQQDIAPDIYGVNQQIRFKLDIDKFPTPLSIYKKTDLIWDFGDGSPKQTIRYGSVNAHTYALPGTYNLTIFADFRTAGFTIEPELLQAVAINVSDSKKVSVIRPTLPPVPTTEPLSNTRESSNTLLFFIPIVSLFVSVLILAFIIIKKRKKKIVKKSKKKRK